jgi:hypothetical protein
MRCEVKTPQFGSFAALLRSSTYQTAVVKKVFYRQSAFPTAVSQFLPSSCLYRYMYIYTCVRVYAYTRIYKGYKGKLRFCGNREGEERRQK